MGQNGQNEEIAKLRAEVAMLKKENMTLKTRARLDYTQGSGGRGQPVLSYARGSNRGARGGRGSGNSGGGRSFSAMSVEEKKATTCSAWNRAATPGGAGGCSNEEVNGWCTRNGVSLRHACNVVRPGTTSICWNKQHTAKGH